MLLFLVGVIYMSAVASAMDVSRRFALEGSLSLAMAPETSPRDQRPLVYRIESSDPPMMQPFEGGAVDGVLRQLARRDCVILGVRRGDPEDAALAAEVAGKLARIAGRKREVAMGLDVAPPDWSGTKIEAWPAAGEDASWLAPLFEMDVPRIGLGVNPEALRRVQREGGLSDAEKAMYVDDPRAFALFAEVPGFEMYAQRTIQRRYARYVADAEDAPSASGYVASSIVQDEAAATLGARYLRSHPGALLIAVLADDRVKFGLGAQARLERLETGDDRPRVASVLLNPSAASTFSETTQLRLSLSEDIDLGYRPRPVADFVWFSKMPPPRLLYHMLNPIDGRFKIDFGLSTGGTAA